MGDWSTNAVSKHVFGGKNWLMAAVVEENDDDDKLLGEVASNVEWGDSEELVLLLVCRLLVAKGGNTCKSDVYILL